MRIYTRRGDDGTTGLFYGGRVRKDAARIEVNGVVDEAQALLGSARAQAAAGSEVDLLLVSLERQLYVLMAEVATAPANRHKLVAGESLVTEAMVQALERQIDELDATVEMPTEFVVPGANPCSAALDVARTVVRRAERALVAAGPLDGLDDGDQGDERSATAAAMGEPTMDGSPSLVGPYLNRLSDLLWMMARWQEGAAHMASRQSVRNKEDGG